MALALTLHVLGVVLWVGGMLFAHMNLRPVAAALLEPPLRLQLWSGVFGRFFPWVWAAVLTIVATGLWIIVAVRGGFGLMDWSILTMLILGLVMAIIFSYIYFVPYQGLKAAVAAQDWPQGGGHLATIRRLVGTNMVIGLVTTIIGAGGRYVVF